MASLIYDEFHKKLLGEWLLREMSDISEEYFCAGWLRGLEYSLWGAIQELPEDFAYGFSVVPAERIMRLKEVAERLGMWGIWDEETLEETLTPLEDWKKQYRERK